MTTVENLFEYRFNVSYMEAWVGALGLAQQCNKPKPHNWLTERERESKWYSSKISYSINAKWAWSQCNKRTMRTCILISTSDFMLAHHTLLLACLRVLNPFFWHIVCWLLWLNASILVLVIFFRLFVSFLNIFTMKFFLLVKVGGVRRVKRQPGRRNSKRKRK